jgi:hypothetical protein
MIYQHQVIYIDNNNSRSKLAREDRSQRLELKKKKMSTMGKKKMKMIADF